MMRTMPRPKKDGDGPKKSRYLHPRYALHIEQGILDALDLYCADQRIKPDKSEVVRVAIREFLEREGYWPPKPE